VIGEWARPKVRLPGGGGGPDAAYRARHLLLLHGGSNWERIVAQVRPVTAAPAPDAVVRLITRWGTVTLGAQPRLDVLVERDDNAGFLDHLHTIGVAAEGYTSAPEWSAEDRKQAVEVLAEAASSGYAVGAAERAGQQRSDRA
jgi:glutaconate CoA-transferase subunit B